MKLFMRNVVVGTFAATALVACGGSDEGGSKSGSGAATLKLKDSDKLVDMTGKSEVEIVASDNKFAEKFVEISAGTKVTFVNKGRNPHNVIPVNDGAFKQIDAEKFAPQDKSAVTFSTVGDVPYYCSLHGTATAGMLGGIRVSE